MKAVVDHLVRGLVRNPDAVRLNTVEGEASVLIELSVAREDVARVNGPEGDTLRAIRAVLSAAAGRRKAVLELIPLGAAASGEE
ncbi:MAG: KH domain-containing protein [Pseudomonadota bacterium]|nr:KH domain-containing protein [Pseudomonadota bacterium]